MHDGWRRLGIKYVIVNKLGTEVAILGCDFQGHSELQGDAAAVAAGKCSISVRNGGLFINAWGESTSLKLKSREEDAQVILDTINFRGA